MSEQFMQAWAVDAKALAAAIGGKDQKLLARACKRELADELREVVEEDDDTTLEEQLRVIVNGEEPETTEWHTLRCVTLLADALGTRVDNDITPAAAGTSSARPSSTGSSRPSRSSGPPSLRGRSASAVAGHT
jgi:hypothetical protein